MTFAQKSSAVLLLAFFGLFLLGTSHASAAGVLELCNIGATEGGALFCDEGLRCETQDALPEHASEDGKSGTCVAELPEGPGTATEILQIIQRVTNWVFAIFTAVGIIYVIIAAFQFITSSGDPGQVEDARRKLIFAAVGFGIALASAGLPNVLRNILEIQ